MTTSKEKILERIPKVLIDTLQLTSDCVTVIEEKPHFVGASKNLDKIDIDDVDAPISIGIDRFKRPFIAIRLLVEETQEGSVITLFQEYANARFPWKSATLHRDFLSFDQPVLTNYGSFMRPDYEFRLKSLGKSQFVNVKGEKIKLW